MTKGKTRVNMLLPDKIIDLLDKEAKEKQTSRTSVLLNILDNYSKQQEIINTMQDMIKMAKINTK